MGSPLRAPMPFGGQLDEGDAGAAFSRWPGAPRSPQPMAEDPRPLRVGFRLLTVHPDHTCSSMNGS